MKITYSEPKIVKASKGWFVKYTVNGKEKREKLGLNRIVDLKEREKEFISLRDVIHRKLKNGWNPNVPAVEWQNVLANEMDFATALNFALKKKQPNLAAKTYLDYSATVNICSASAKQVGLHTVPIAEFKRAHVKLILENAKTRLKWSNFSYNKHVSYIKAVLSELIEYDILETNPAFKIKKLPTEKSTLNAPANSHQFSLIKEALKQHPDYYVFVITIFHTLCRPVELLRVRVGMVDMDARVINLPAAITKSRKKGRAVPINDFLLPYFEAMNLQSVDPNYFLFGTFKQPSRPGNHEKWFYPAPYEIHRNRSSELWKLYIKDSLSLNITQYSNKHANVDALLENGAPLQMVSRACGHTKEKTTEIYASILERKEREALNNFARDYGDV